MKYAGPLVFLALILLIGLATISGCATTEQIEVIHTNPNTQIAGDI